MRLSQWMRVCVERGLAWEERASEQMAGGVVVVVSND